jgi:small multidrug resistance pump
MDWIYLGFAICTEVIATSALKASESFTRLWPSVLVVCGYSISFYLLSLTLRSVPVGIVYAVWSGIGLVLITLAAWYLYGQKLDLAAFFGITLIVSGTIVLNVFSKATVH